MPIYESKSYTKGKRLSVFTIDGWKFATCICYDLRFPEIFIHYMEKEQVDVFIVPATFTVKTGQRHWKTLLKARAIETQSYVLAPAQVGYHRDFSRNKLRKSWGQSLVINPWGKVLEETSNYNEFLDLHSPEHEPISIEMKTTEIMNYRKSIPISHHRHFKTELFVFEFSSRDHLFKTGFPVNKKFSLKQVGSWNSHEKQRGWSL